MDPNYNPHAPASKIKIGKNILEKSEESQLPAHSPLSEPVKAGANPYSISQAFQTGLPGVNR